MAGRTQAALYAEIDLELSWSEDALPQVERTKHVHGLHPYLGKFVPQLVEVFLRRYFAPGSCVYDPFAGSGTTIVAAEHSGRTCLALEIDPRYAQVALERWEAFTGRRATCLGPADASFPASSSDSDGGDHG